MPHLSGTSNPLRHPCPGGTLIRDVPLQVHAAGTIHAWQTCFPALPRELQLRGHTNRMDSHTSVEVSASWLAGGSQAHSGLEVTTRIWALRHGCCQTGARVDACCLLGAGVLVSHTQTQQLEHHSGCGGVAQHPSTSQMTAYCRRLRGSTTVLNRRTVCSDWLMQSLPALCSQTRPAMHWFPQGTNNRFQTSTHVLLAVLHHSRSCTCECRGPVADWQHQPVGTANARQCNACVGKCVCRHSL